MYNVPLIQGKNINMDAYAFQDWLTTVFLSV